MARRIQSSPFAPQQRAAREREVAYHEERKRTTAYRLHTSRAWRNLRLEVLREQPACPCGAAASVVDHIVPHRGDQVRFFDRGNLQALCKRCHDRKTVQQDGGFGNKRQASEPDYGGGDGFGFA